ncbi:MAG: hypothetical protein U0790_06820 [Isosphaeraceae bacterium]
MNADGSKLRQLTHEELRGGQDAELDGRRPWIYFGQRAPGSGPPRMCRIHPDGSDLEGHPSGRDQPAISPDGRTVVYAREVEAGIACSPPTAAGGTSGDGQASNSFAEIPYGVVAERPLVIFADRVGESLELFRCDREEAVVAPPAGGRWPRPRSRLTGGLISFPALRRGLLARRQAGRARCKASRRQARSGSSIGGSDPA